MTVAGAACPDVYDCASEPLAVVARVDAILAPALIALDAPDGAIPDEAALERIPAVWLMNEPTPVDKPRDDDGVVEDEDDDDVDESLVDDVSELLLGESLPILCAVSVRDAVSLAVAALLLEPRREDAPPARVAPPVNAPTPIAVAVRTAPAAAPTVD